MRLLRALVRNVKRKMDREKRGFEDMALFGGFISGKI